LNSSVPMEVVDGIGRCRPIGRYSLVEAVDLVSQAIAQCRRGGVDRLLVDATGFLDLPVPTLVERFLMVEDWANEADGKVTVSMVVRAEFIDPQKFGVKVADRFGLVCDVHTSPEAALHWLTHGHGVPD
jgi:hypothetical protein